MAAWTQTVCTPSRWELRSAEHLVGFPYLLAGELVHNEWFVEIGGVMGPADRNLTQNDIFGTTLL